jgi:hypothetical protein
LFFRQSLPRRQWRRKINKNQDEKKINNVKYNRR